MKPLSEALIENSKSAIIGCVELHNKPLFNYRYEICIILAINGWELLLKAFIIENNPEIKLLRKDGTTKPFEECVSIVNSIIGKPFLSIGENLAKLYEYRCHVIHFYKEHLDPILYSLLHKSVLNYNGFIKEHFNIDLAEETQLLLLPIGFKPFISPIDFLSIDSNLNKSSPAVKTFIKSITDSAIRLSSEDINDSILTGYRIAVVNENRISNADIIAGITKDPNKANLQINNVVTDFMISDAPDAKKIKIEEETLFNTIFTLKYNYIAKKAKEIYSDFKQNPKFNRVMSEIKNDPALCRKRYLDVINKSGTAQDFYSHEVFNELSKHYKIKE